MDPTFPLPAPRDTVAGCMWLPRLLAKARAHRAGTLPPAYARPFGHAAATDGQFLGFFGLTVDQVLEGAAQPPEQDAAWFLGLPGVNADRIAAWNELAQNLGKPGYPMHERFKWALVHLYGHLDRTRVGSVFEALEADEER